jgi:hypothetical protein
VVRIRGGVAVVVATVGDAAPVVAAPVAAGVVLPPLGVPVPDVQPPANTATAATSATPARLLVMVRFLLIFKARIPSVKDRALVPGVPAA